MNLKKLTATLVVIGMAVTASAVPVTSTRLLGTIVPGTPADPDNEQVMVNFLVVAYNSNPAARTLGDNPLDPQTENYRLIPGSAVPAGPLPLAATTGRLNVTSNNTTLDVGSGGFTYITAKFGQDSEVLYIGGLTGSITIGNFTGNQNGLSGYTLFNPGSSRVPDGGVTIALLGVGLLGLGAMRRKLS